MHNEPGVGGQPPLDRWGLVRRGIVDNYVNVKLSGHFTVDGVKELLELNSVVTGVQRPDWPDSCGSVRLL
jgi:hypothetical protein